LRSRVATAKSRNFLRRIDARCQLYADSPLLGDLREELGENVRRFHVGRYEVLYCPAEVGILILLVVHSARDIEAVFRDAFRTGD
jgi:toxin ParE1/3/4